MTDKLARRRFLKTGGLAVAGAISIGCGPETEKKPVEANAVQPASTEFASHEARLLPGCCAYSFNAYPSTPSMSDIIRIFRSFGRSDEGSPAATVAGTEPAAAMPTPVAALCLKKSLRLICFLLLPAIRIERCATPKRLRRVRPSSTSGTGF